MWTVAAAVAAAGLAGWIGVSAAAGPYQLGALMVFAAAVPGIALCDAVTRRIPFPIAWTLGTVFAAAAVLGFLADRDPGPAKLALVGAGIALLALGSVAFFSGGGIARGDIAIGTVYALPLGMLEVRAVAWWLLLSLLLAVPVAAVRLRQRGKSHRMPLGPFLMAGWALTLLVV